ncbi:MAG: nuclear transport factor 2 family protein [Acidobacteriota bacterium]|nr:nuclear transport factor 2 family protein [Acidobacteriota bacterium]MDH3523547.1 nuclear transport factor 2 family protein [Acidobacteriota bacterium]
MSWRSRWTRVLLAGLVWPAAGWGAGVEPPDISPYLIDHAEETALALSAGPRHVTAEATVLLFTPDGYETEREGSNGFVCLVERSWTNATEWSNFLDPAIRVPICYNREAAETILPVYLEKAKLAMAGHPAEEIQRALDAGFRAGRFRAPEGTAMSYMISAGQYLGGPAGAFRPHVMLYSPYSTDDDWGDNRMPTDFPLLLMEVGGPHAVVVIPVPDRASREAELQGAGDAPSEESHPAETVARELTRAIDYFDLEAFADSFSDDVTMFYPIASLAQRVDGREALARIQGQVFDTLEAQLREAGTTEPPYFGLEPQDLKVQTLGEDAAVVTWHVDRGTHLGRRTAVVRQLGGSWRIVSYHASNVDY